MLQSMGLQRIRDDQETNTFTSLLLHDYFSDLKCVLEYGHIKDGSYVEEPQQKQIPFHFVKRIQGHHHSDN